MDNILINKAIEIRRQKKLSVADAIIAATALVYNCELVTRNTKDFQNIINLKILDPIDNK